MVAVSVDAQLMEKSNWLQSGLPVSSTDQVALVGVIYALVDSILDHIVPERISFLS